MESVDGASKKVALEDLSKEELVKKCKHLVAIAHKAKSVKDSLTEENANLQEQLQNKERATNEATQELIESLTQQKLNFVTNISELKNQKNVLNEKLIAAESRISELDTENQGYKRQVFRLTDENEELINHLDQLEKEINELKKIGLQQQEQLLELERNNKSLAEANNKIKLEHDANELVESEKLKSEISILKAETEILRSSEDSESLQKQIADCVNEIEKLKANEIEYKQQITSQKEEIEKYINSTDDLNVELHKNKALVENLKRDLSTTNSKLSESQIMSSGVTSDLQNANERMKEKLQFFHSKMVKLATSVKTLRQEKDILLCELKDYMGQVKLWKGQLNIFLQKFSDEYDEFSGNYRRNLQQLKEENLLLRNENVKLLQKGEEGLEVLDEENQRLKNTLEECLKKCEVLTKTLEDSEEEKAVLNEKIKESIDVEAEIKILQDALEKEKKENTTLGLTVQKEQERIKEFELLTSCFQDAESEKKILLDNLEKEKHENKNLILEIQKEKAKINDLEESLQKSEIISKNYLDNLISIQKIILGNDNLNTDELFQGIKKIMESSSKIPSLEKSNLELQEELNTLKNTETELAAHTSQEIEKLVFQNNELLEKIKQLQEKPTSSVEMQTDHNSEELERELIILRREKLELLAQMNEMNQELKERSESISQQEVHCKELMKKVHVYETQASKKEEVIKGLMEQLDDLGSKGGGDVLEEKNVEIVRLKAELDELKENLNRSLSENPQDSFAENEAMSTSTISRTEEVNRLKDLEGPWEERYGKLRALATKMKGKIRDLATELAKEQSEKSEAHSKLANSLKTVHTLQVKCDKLEDELENSRSEAKGYLKKLDSVAQDISKDKQTLALNEEKIVGFKHEIEELKRDKAEVENWKRQVGAKVKSLKQEIEANNVLKKDYESKITKLQQDLEAKDQALRNEIERHKHTRNSLQESNNECKKKSVLNLEMQDYERSVNELSAKLEDKQETITQLKNQIDTTRSTTNALREQNKLLEERLETEESELTTFRAETIAQRRKINELEDLMIQKDDKIHSLNRLIEETRLENEELSRELSKVIAEHQKNTSGLKIEVDRLRRQILGLEQSLREARDSLRLREEELKVVEQEYKGYKVRAQSVLRQNQTRDIGAEEKLLEEVASLKLQVGNLNRESKELQVKVSKLTKEKETLKTENEELKRKCQEAELRFEDEKLQLEQLKYKHQQTVNEHTDTVRGLKLHADTLAQCYRQQLSDQEVRHNHEIIELQSKLNKTPTPTEPLPSYPSMTREEGEGSESVNSVSPTGNSRPVPLEHLLNSEGDGEVALLKRQLAENESKVAHLTDLLADTEQDLAKHVQMNQVLKEEIRRQQRSVERERHAENLEYLKNVILKFITLNNNDERLRLVPVMNTILKLSPEETNQLNMVAKGDASKGWSNYLPLAWPSNRSN